jgi:hypothetical protein
MPRSNQFNKKKPPAKTTSARTPAEAPSIHFEIFPALTPQ